MGTCHGMRVTKWNKRKLSLRQRISKIMLVMPLTAIFAPCFSSILCRILNELYCFLKSSFNLSNTFALNSFTISSVISSCFISYTVDTINYTNEFNKENKQKAKEQEEEKALAKEQAKAMIKMLADSNVKTEDVDEKVH
jgi:uncharacterized membrane protein (DUF106 family)